MNKYWDKIAANLVEISLIKMKNEKIVNTKLTNRVRSTSAASTNLAQNLKLYRNVHLTATNLMMKDLFILDGVSLRFLSFYPLTYQSKKC